MSEQVIRVGSRKVTLTNQDKVYWPDEGITKGELVTYYDRMGKWILPYLKDRPQSLKRNPNGIRDAGFFQKNAGGDAPSWVSSIKIHSDSSARMIDYILCNDKATLLYLANLGCIELNPWFSRVKKLEHPDYMVLDIDPADHTPFDQVVDAALAVKQVLDEAGAPSWCKTSGASGLHVYVPLAAKYSYDQAAPFAELVAQKAAELLPGTATTIRNLQKRGNRIYLDHLQNRYGQTLACAYSARPKPGATVSTPLKWSEVKHGLDKSRFTIHTVPGRVEKLGDLFSGVLKKGIDLRKCLGKLDG